jgi:hypothetical protein
VSDKVESLAIEIPSSEKTKTGKIKKGERYFISADASDKKKAQNMESLKISHWYPTDEFPVTPSITHKFVSDIGGNSFQYLWTSALLPKFLKFGVPPLGGFLDR